jgi:hypothetical protein
MIPGLRGGCLEVIVDEDWLLAGLELSFVGLSGGLVWSVCGEKCRDAAEEVHMQPDTAGKCCPMTRLPLLPLLSPGAAAISEE